MLTIVLNNPCKNSCPITKERKQPSSCLPVSTSNFKANSEINKKDYSMEKSQQIEICKNANPGDKELLEPRTAQRN